MSEPSEIDAADVARKEFATSFRGYDTYAVRAFLGRVAAELAAAKERARTLADQLVQAEAKAVPPELGEAELTSALGQQAARVLQATHEAATELRARADLDVAALRAEAEAAATAVREEAEALLGQRTAEAQAAADSLLHEARAQAEAEVDAAQQQGREMVAEAQAVRERVLRDLARRRRLAHAQLEQLRAGRERLLEAYRVAQGALDEATTELTSAEVEARTAAEAAARRAEAEPEASLEELEAEVQVARDAGLTVNPRTADREPSSAAGGPPVADEVIEGPIGVGEVDGPGEAPFDVDAEPDRGGGGASGGGGGGGAGERSRRRRRRPEEPAPVPTGPALSATGDQGSSVRILRREVGREPLVDLVELDEATPVGQDAVAAADSSGATADGEDAASREVPDPLPETDVEPGSGDGLDALFASLRADRGGSEPGAEVGAPVTASTTAEPTVALAEPVRAEPTVALAEPTVALAEPVLDEPVVDEAARAPFAARDEALAPIEATVTRKLKRVLSDEQNQVLDALRRATSVAGLDDLLPDLDQHRARFADVLVPALEQAALAGAGPKARRLPSAVDPAALGRVMATEIVDDLRDRVAASAGDASDAAVRSDGVSSAYREWKSTRVDPLVRHHLLVAHTEGAYAGVRARALRWAVDPVAGCSPDCADNALAGPVRKGTTFPTGDLRPPAFVGCRCLLVADR